MNCQQQRKTENTFTSVISWSFQSLNNTFGWRRMEVVGGISSLVFLFSLCFATAIEVHVYYI